MGGIPSSYPSKPMTIATIVVFAISLVDLWYWGWTINRDKGDKMSTAKFYDKRATVEAFQMTLERRHNLSEWPEWFKKAAGLDPSEFGAVYEDKSDESGERLLIRSLDGLIRININDWVIRKANGELNSLQPDIFRQTYEALGK